MMKRLLLALPVLGLAISGCQKPTRTVPATFDSPRDVEFVRWCSNADFSEISLYDEGCEDTEIELAWAIVANSGGRMVHRVRVDSREPSYDDLDVSVPGVTGVSVPEGPIDIQMLAHPSLVAVISEVDSALSFVEIFNGELASISYDDGSGPQDVTTGSLPLVEPVSLMRGVNDGETSLLFLVEPIAHRLRALSVSGVCGSSATSVSTGCAASVSVVEEPSLALPGSPTDVAIRDDGRVFVTVRDDQRIFVGALFGADMDASCGGTPCIFDTMGTGWQCLDGIDNDGDGLLDAEDPQCFAGSSDESGQELLDGSLTQCTNGIDDDGNGVLDADDPGCRGSADRVEGEGYDGVDEIVFLEGETRSACGNQPVSTTLLGIPSQDSVALPGGASVELPDCSNGEDDDGDGAADWPDDTDCYGPNDSGEAATAFSILAATTLSEEGDLLYTVDRRTRQLFVHDADTLELLNVNEFGDSNHTTPGTRLLSSFQGPLIADTSVFSSALTDEGTAGGETVTHARLTQRRVHIATASGYADTVVIDAAYELFNGDPTEDGVQVGNTEYNEIYEPFDTDGSAASLRRVDCTIPTTDDPALFQINGCSDVRLPAPVAAPNPCSGDGAPVYPPSANDYFAISGGYYGSLISRQEIDFTPDEDECGAATTEVLERTATADDYAISGGVWSVVYQGRLNGTLRDDGILMTGETEGRRWVEYAGEDPCQADSEPDFCSVSAAIFEDSTCPELRSLCTEFSSAQICDDGIDVCGVCPSACRSAVDFCAAGVMPNDLLEIERQSLISEDEACAPFAQMSRAELVDAAKVEYVICAVTEAHLEVAPLSVGCDGFAGETAVSPVRSTYEAVTTLPPEGCFGEPLTTLVRSGEWLVRIGESTGPSPYRAVDGQCVLRSDAEDRFMRLTPDHIFDSPFGLAMTVAGPAEDTYVDTDGDGDLDLVRGDAVCLPLNEDGELVEDSREVFGRDFALRYTVDRNFSFRTDSSRQLLLGPATSAMAIGDTDSGRRIIVVDESQSFVWVYSAATYREVASPLP